MSEAMTIPALQQMKRDGKKSVGVVAWDYQIARIADRAGVDIVSVGDSVGVNLWGHANPLEVTIDEMLVVCKAVRRGVTRALIDAALKAARTAKAPAVEAYPLDADVSPSATGTGYATTFARAGFREVARHSPERPIMRYELSPRPTQVRSRTKEARS